MAKYLSKDGKLLFSEDGLIFEAPENGITPTGSIEITENGTYDVTDKAEAVVEVQGGGYNLFGDWTIYNPDTSIVLESDLVTAGAITLFLGNFYQAGKPTFIQSTKSFDELESNEVACAYVISATASVVSRRQNASITFTNAPSSSTVVTILRANTTFVRMVYNYV